MLNTAETKRRNILSSASEVFSRRGYKATTMQLIAQEAQTTITSIKGYYDDKHAVFSELYSDICDRLEVVVSQPVAGAGLVEYCSNIIDGVLEVFEQNRNIAWVIFTEYPAGIKRIRERRASRLLEHTHALLRRMAALDMLKVEDAYTSAQLCYGNMQHAIFQWITGAWDISRVQLCAALLVFNMRALNCVMDYDDAQHVIQTN